MIIIQLLMLIVEMLLANITVGLLLYLNLAVNSFRGYSYSDE